MRLEKRLNLRLASEDISILESEEELETSIQSEPNRGVYRSIVDAIKRFLNMSPRDLLQFATEGGSIEENILVIESLTPQTILEQEVRRVVQTGNYYKVVEVRMPGQGFEYKGFLVARLSVPNDKIAKALQAKMAGWKPGQPVPFDWYKTEAEALKVMGSHEAKAAGKSPTPAQPIKQKVTKSSVAQTAAKMAEQMGNPEAAGEIIKMNNENIIRYADLGLKNKTDDNWKVVKTVFLAWLALSALVTGAAGLAALVIGYLAVKGIEYSKKSRIKEDLDDQDAFGASCPECMRNTRTLDDDDGFDDPDFHAAHTAAAEEAIRRGLETKESRHSRIRRAWGADPEAWQQCWDEVMGQHGYTRDMSGFELKWVRNTPE